MSSVSAERCSLAARARDDSLRGTALPVQRFILIEVPGPWVTGFWDAAALPGDVGRHLRDSAIAAHARLLLIRRPGRHPVDRTGPRRWCVVTRDGFAWGEWHLAPELLKLDVLEQISALGADPGRSERPLALVCTHGRKDVCCAIEGRPVASVLAVDPRLDVWECSHVGGDRFAANMLWLPSGLMFGGLTTSTVRGVVDKALSSRVDLKHFRGRCGDPLAAQVARHIVMEHVGDDRSDAVTVDPIAEEHPAIVVRHAGTRYAVELEPIWTQPHHLTCQASADARMRTFRVVSFGEAPA